MKFDRDFVFLIRKVIIGFAVMFFASLLQTSLLDKIEPFGAIPDLSLVMVAGVGCFCGSFSGGMYGIFAGVVSYALGDVGAAFLPVVYGAIGFLSGLLVERFFKGKFVVWCIYVLCGGLLKAAYSLGCCLLFSGHIQLWQAIGGAILPELLGTFILGAAMYVPVRKICRLL